MGALKQFESFVHIRYLVAFWKLKSNTVEKRRGFPNINIPAAILPAKWQLLHACKCSLECTEA